jgi:hypothetical protein
MSSALPSPLETPYEPSSYPEVPEVYYNARLDPKNFLKGQSSAINSTLLVADNLSQASCLSTLPPACVRCSRVLASWLLLASAMASPLVPHLKLASRVSTSLAPPPRLRAWACLTLPSLLLTTSLRYMIHLRAASPVLTQRRRLAPWSPRLTPSLL